MKASTKALQAACTLNDEEFAERRKMVREELIPHIARVVRLENGVRYEFMEGGVERDLVERYAELERQCCGFLTFALSVPDDALTLTAEGPPDAQPLYDELVSGASA